MRDASSLLYVIAVNRAAIAIVGGKIKKDNAAALICVEEVRIREV